MDLHSILIFISSLIILSIASYQDIKTRYIDNILWLILATIGFILSIIYYKNFWPELTLMYILIILWYFDIMFYEYIIDAIILIINIYLMINSSDISFNIDVFLIMIYKYLFILNLIQGKADARAIMSITIISPKYPSGFTYLTNVKNIVNILFPYSLEILFYALIINAIVFGIYVSYKNYKNGAKISFTHIYSNGEYKKYETPFIFSITLAFILSYILSLFSII
ncbi:MAG: hypothetical protein ACP5LM_04300 [Thermoplasmata archaeon]